MGYGNNMLTNNCDTIFSTDCGLTFVITSVEDCYKSDLLIDF